MAEHGCTISLSQMSPTSDDDDSSDQQTPNTAGDGASGGSSSHRRLPPSAGHHQLQALSPLPKKPRGRPPGSKNKPKPALVINQENEQVLKPVIIEVAAGSDVVEALVNFARRRHAGISVLSGSGSIANVTLRHPLSHAPAFTLHGPFTLLSLSGTYISTPFPRPPPPPLMAASSSSSSNPNTPSAASWPACNSFGISFSGSQGHIFGGVVAGKVVAASVVVVMTTVFKKPELHRVGFNGNGDDGEGDNPNASGDQGGGGGNDTMSGFNIASPTPLSSQLPADVNLMQWGHSHSSSRPANY